jgi:hypothetical protein
MQTHMTTDETSFFKLFYEYARKQHNCFLAEMFLRTQETGYYLCLRPVSVRQDSSSRYKCKYLLIPADQVRSAAETGTLPVSLIERVDLELSALSQVI